MSCRASPRLFSFLLAWGWCVKSTLRTGSDSEWPRSLCCFVTCIRAGSFRALLPYVADQHEQTKASPAFLDSSRPQEGLLEESASADEGPFWVLGRWHAQISDFIPRQIDQQWVAGATSEGSVGHPIFICLWALSVNARMNKTNLVVCLHARRNYVCRRQWLNPAIHPAFFEELRSTSCFCGTDISIPGICIGPL